MKTILKTTPFLFLLLACSTESELAASTDSELGAVRWEPVLRCDDGTTLDVNANERREVQLVVRGRPAVDYLTTALPDPYAGNVRPNAKGELIFQGGVFNYDKPGASPPPQGIFSPRDVNLASGTAGNMSAHFVPEGNAEIRIFLDIPFEERPLESTPMPSNWIFRNCH